MIDIGAVTDWEVMTSGEVITFDAENPRPVNLSVNTTGPVAVYVRQVGGDDHFLVGKVDGLEKLKFEVPGAYELFGICADEVNAYFKVSDGYIAHRENLDEKTFTTLHIERTIDPNVQAVINAMQRQHMQVVGDMKISMEKELARLWNERPANAGVPVQEQAPVRPAPAEEARPVEPSSEANG